MHFIPKCRANGSKLFTEKLIVYTQLGVSISLLLFFRYYLSALFTHLLFHYILEPFVVLPEHPEMTTFEIILGIR